MLSLTLDTSSFQGGLELKLHAEQVWEESQSIKYTTLVGYSNLSRHTVFLSSLLSSPHSEDGICAQLAPVLRVQHDVPSLQRFCSVWRVDIYWCNNDGITIYTLNLLKIGEILHRATLQ